MRDVDPLRWLRKSDDAFRPFVAMVVGWQSVTTTLNAAVRRFNEQYFASTDDSQRATKRIAAKMSVIASLRELSLALSKWRDQLARRNSLSKKSKGMWRELRPTLKQIHGFKEIRNCAFHFGDFLEEPEDLLDLYEDIQKYDLDYLNKLLTALYEFGFQLEKDALEAIEG